MSRMSKQRAILSLAMATAAGAGVSIFEALGNTHKTRMAARHEKPHALKSCAWCGTPHNHNNVCCSAEHYKLWAASLKKGEKI